MKNIVFQLCVKYKIQILLNNSINGTLLQKVFISEDGVCALINYVNRKTMSIIKSETKDALC